VSIERGPVANCVLEDEEMAVWASLINIAHLFSAHPLTRNAPLKAWVRFVSWQIKSRLKEEVIVPWIAGQYLAVRRGMTGATGNIYVGLHEFVDMMFVLHFLRDGDLFIDIGANIGSYAVLASGVCRATTWAFEPDPSTVRKLKRNIAVNNLDALVTVYECALGANEGEVPLTVGRDTGNRVVDVRNKDVQIVAQQRLDALMGVASRPVMMAKIDVEGYEEEVIRGAKALLANDQLKVIDLEWPASSIREVLSSHNFIKAYYDPFSRRLEREPVNAVSSQNSLFVRDWEFISSRLIAADKIKILGHSI
jgi:FkbM family methyltransferase